MSSVSSTTPSTNKSCFIATLPIKHPELNGALLGRNGSEIKKLKESSEYQFRIKLYNENNMENKKLFDCTHIRVESSSEEGLRDAVKILKERINKLKENRMMREKEKEKEISSILKLDVNHKPMFIGKNGRNIKSLEDNNQYYWGIIARDSDGFIVGSNDNIPNTLVVGTLSIDEDLVPDVFVLHQNYPNPFNPTTQIQYDLPGDQFVNIVIYDVMGRNIRNLMNVNQTAGYHVIRWDARNDMGEGVAAGMYIYTIQAGEFNASKKMVLLK